MTQSLFSMLIHTAICLIFIFSLNTISVAQNPDRYPDHPLERYSKVKLKIYYETLCPSCIKYFKEQLAPAVGRLASYLDVYLIPYGKAQCAQRLNVVTDGIWECVRSERSTVLLKGYGDDTKAMGVTTVPYVVLDGAHDKSALVNLMDSVCKRLSPPPHVCGQYY